MERYLITIMIGCLIYLAYQAFLVVTGKMTSWVQLQRRAQNNLADFLVARQRQGACEPSMPELKAPVEAEKNGHVPTASSQFERSEVIAFYYDWLEPYKTVLLKLKTYETVIELLNLLDSEGSCPSVAGSGHYGEPSRISDACGPKCYDLLRQVSLSEHSINVASALIHTQERQSENFVMLLGVFLVLGLGHDIGKIPGIEKRVGGFADRCGHADVSKRVLSKLLADDFPYRQDVLNAVANHHQYEDASNYFDKLLKIADHTARLKELKKLQPFKGEPVDLSKIGNDIDLSWLDVGQVFEALDQHINTIDSTGRYLAFSFGKVVYIQPPLVFEVISQLAITAQRYDISTVGLSQGGRNRVIKAFKDKISEHVCPGVKKGYLGQKFSITSKRNQVMNPGFYLPVKIGVFPTPPKSIEARKVKLPITHLLRNIDSIHVVRA